MATIINADTSDGLKFTSDTSGEIKLQSAGTDIATVNSSGVSATTFIPTSSTAPTNGVYLPTTNTVGLATNSTERMRINSSGTLFLGQTSNPATGSMVIKVPTGTGNGINFQSTGTATSYAIGIYNNTGGLSGFISFTTTTTTYATSSDYRLKENVALMSGSIDRLKKLKPSTWTWTQDGSYGEGFLAHEAQEVVPESVTGTKDAIDDEGNPVYQGIDQSKLVPLLTAALQEAITKIEDLETRIQALETN